MSRRNITITVELNADRLATLEAMVNEITARSGCFIDYTAALTALALRALDDAKAMYRPEEEAQP